MVYIKDDDVHRLQSLRNILEFGIKQIGGRPISTSNLERALALVDEIQVNMKELQQEQPYLIPSIVL
jgi:hypothetical protein